MAMRVGNTQSAQPRTAPYDTPQKCNSLGSHRIRSYSSDPRTLWTTCTISMAAFTTTPRLDIAISQRFLLRVHMLARILVHSWHCRT